MIDLKNLTLVQELTINNLKWKWNSKHPEYWFYEFHHFFQIPALPKATKHTPKKDIINALDCRDRLNSNKSSWMHKRAFEKVCNRISRPNVKLTGYTRQQALKEAREVIQFVKLRAREAR